MSTGDSAHIPIDLRQVLLSSFVRQTSVRFRFPPHILQDHDRHPWVIYNKTGVTYIAMNGPIEKPPPPDHFPATFTVPKDDRSPESLRILTGELTQSTTDLFDIEIVALSLTWGLKSGELPSLIECEGAFKCTRESKPYAIFLTDIALFIALETGQVQEPGKCFSRRAVCVAPEILCARQKIETWRIKKLADGLKVNDRAEFVHYVKRRLGLVCPLLLVNNVLVCRNCFALYARERMPMGSGESPPSARSGRGAGAILRGSAPADRHRPETSVMGWKKSPSGLTYVQDISGRAVQRAKKTYIAKPIPAFLQHPV